MKFSTLCTVKAGAFAFTLLLLSHSVLAGGLGGGCVGNPGTFANLPSGPGSTMTTGRAFFVADTVECGVGCHGAAVAGGLTADGITRSGDFFDKSFCSFDFTGNMTTPRANFAEAALGEPEPLVSELLFVGGFGSDGRPLASAETLNAITGTTSLTGRMSVARAALTATTLNNGQVLVVGGFDEAKTLSSAELYNPNTRTFSPTGRMKEARANFTATLLTDGTVLVAGGAAHIGKHHDARHALTSAEIYDPATGAFSSVGPMTSARYFHTATLLTDGKVLIAGGFDNTRQPLDSADLYDPRTRCFSASASKMTSARAGHTATYVGDQILLAGGIGKGFKAIVNAELYESDADKFGSTGAMNHPRAFHTAVGFPGFAVLFGGINDRGIPQSTAEYYSE